MKRISLQSPEFHNNVHEELARIRAAQPFHRGKLTAMMDVWLITRHADIEELLTGDALKKNPFSGGGAPALLQKMLPRTVRTLTSSLLMADPPDHRRLRRLVQRAFTPRTVQALEGRIEEIADGLLDACLDKGHFDLIEHYALPLPVRIIAEMVGIPDEDIDRFKELAHGVIQPMTPANLPIVLPALYRFSAYIKELATLRRRDPREDLMTGLVKAEEDGDTLSEDELVSMVFTLLLAGHETTVSLIANGALALLRHPEQRARLRAEPVR